MDLRNDETGIGFVLNGIMRIATYVIVLGFISPQMANCQSGDKISAIEVSKSSRGYQEHVRITPDSIHVFSENRIDGSAPIKRTTALPAGAWERLVATVDDINLKAVPELPSPSMKRAADAAMHASIAITTDGGATYVHGYDDENPHKLLKPLLERVREIAGPSIKP